MDSIITLPITLTADDVESFGSGKKFLKQILPLGKFMHPAKQGVQVEITEEFIDEVIRVFELGTFDKVPILSGTHDNDDVAATVGKVLELQKDSEGLNAIMELTDEVMIEKITTKTSDGKSLVSGVSVYIHPTKDKDGNVYPVALWHVAITNFPWLTSMNDFEELAASVPMDKIFVPARFALQQNLSQQVSSVSNAFYDQVARNDYSIYIKEVWDEYVIVTDGVKLLRYDYTLGSDGDVTFGDPTTVEIQYIPLEVIMGNVEEKDVLEFLKGQGIELTLPELKEKAMVDVDSLLSHFGLSKGEFDKLGEKITETVKNNESLVASNKILEETKTQLITRVDALEVSKLDIEAESAVKEGMAAGKIVGATKDHYLKLYKADKELFEGMLSNAPVIVDTTELGTSTGKDDLDGTGMTDDKVEEEKGRYLEMAKKGSNGKKDKED